MSFRQLMKKQALLLAGLLLTLPLTSFAGDVPSPQVPKAKQNASADSACVEPVADMRKNHMNYLLHQRDDTLRKGVRTKQHSLAECINCHVTPDKEGVMPSFGEDDHFCSSCHNYASVSVDCFQCHNDKPENTNYKHSMVDGTYHHNKIALKKNALTKETLDALVTGGKH